ncbi:MAG: hypothetical protein DCF28_09515 [Alphaproteobacteria bacterium]|nr:MAG: hypothetical protein DCF28_09515 [Alphaproteobacteria bacterium]PZO39540.1 MAG: hypothetical protein DCE92_04175 [Alphaproteobacteria bacterium]
MRTLSIAMTAVALGLPAHTLAQSAWTIIPSSATQSRIVAATWSDGTNVVARCDSGKLTAFVRLTERMSGPAVYVLTQRENDVPIGGWWVVSDDGSSAVSRNPRYLVRDLKQGGRLDVVLKSRDAPDREMTLALPDQTTELDSVMSSCGLTGTPNPITPDRPAAQWRERPRPTASDFPAAALAANITGQVVVNCLVSESLQPESCIVVDEVPAGAGFGPAAVQIVSRGKLAVVRSSADLGDVPAFTITIRLPIDGQPLPTLTFATRIADGTRGLWPAETP